MNTATFICGDDPTIDHDGASVTVIDSLCRRPIQVVENVGDADRVVMLLHKDAYDLADVQKALRSADVDPLGTQILDLPGNGSPDELPTTIAGLESRATAFAGSKPEHAKPILRRAVTRRGLFKLPNPDYVAAPMVDHGVCAADNGCRACADVCPQDAYRWHQGRIHYNKDVCEPCGVCVTACPTGAIDNPAAAPVMLAAQIATLIREADPPIGVRFVCSRGTELDATPGWYDVVVPCTGMVPGTWLLTALLMGAGCATTIPCTDNGCPLGLDSHGVEAIDFARSALAAADLDPQHVPDTAGELVSPLANMEPENPFAGEGSVEVMVALSNLAAAPLAFSHTGAGIGIVSIDPAACTLCTQCAQTCPTGAITADYQRDAVSLLFSAADCTNCGQCITACPEQARGAISVTGRVDVQQLTSPRHTLHEGKVLHCAICGEPIAPSSMMDRIGELLGDDFDQTMVFLSQRCMSCRGLS